MINNIYISKSFTAITVLPGKSHCLWSRCMSDSCKSDLPFEPIKKHHHSSYVCGLYAYWSMKPWELCSLINCPYFYFILIALSSLRSTPAWNTKSQKGNFRVSSLHLLCLCTKCWCSKQFHVKILYIFVCYSGHVFLGQAMAFYIHNHDDLLFLTK